MNKKLTYIFFATLLVGSVACAADEPDFDIDQLEMQSEQGDVVTEQIAPEELIIQDDVLSEQSDVVSDEVQEQSEAVVVEQDILAEELSDEDGAPGSVQPIEAQVPVAQVAEDQVEIEQDLSSEEQGSVEQVTQSPGKIDKKQEKKEKREARKQERAEKRQARRESRQHRYDMAAQLAHKKELEKKNNVIARRTDRVKLEKQFADMRKSEVARDYESGKYADVYMQPSWDTPATYVPLKHLFNVGLGYSYATDAYSSEGAKMDVAHAAFGDKKIQLKDLLLVAKMLQEGKLDADDGMFSAYVKAFADKEIKFLGEANELRANFDLSRYIWKRNLLVGVRVPFVHQKHTLRTAEPVWTYNDREPYVSGTLLSITKSLNVEATTEHVKIDDVNPELLLGALNYLYMQYGSFDNFVKDIFRAKGMKELGGSASGVGDVELYAHVNFESVRFEDMVIGAKIIAPTAQKRSSGALWSPELGNGGFWQTALFGGLSIHKNKYVNPHMFMQVQGSWDAHVDRRVPKKMTITAKNGNISGVAFGDRVSAPTPDMTIGDYQEAPFREIGDNVLNVKMRKGIEFNARLGNMTEKFIYRRAFLDIFYDLYIKAKDSFYGFKVDEWNIDPYKLDSYIVAHKVGAEYSYQFDKYARLRLGADYVFAGRNTAQDLSAHVNMNYSF